jgi:hypothetical protein
MESAISVKTSPRFMRVGRAPIIVGSLDEAVGILSSPDVASKVGPRTDEYGVKSKVLGGIGSHIYEAVFYGNRRTNIGIKRPLC